MAELVRVCLFHVIGFLEIIRLSICLSDWKWRIKGEYLKMAAHSFPFNGNRMKRLWEWIPGHHPIN